MAWANHSRCLHCGARLALFRKLTDDEFCSAVHRKAFQDDQCRLAMARLMETQQAFRRVSDEARKLAGMEHATDTPPPSMGPLPMCLEAQTLDPRIGTDPLAYDAAGDPALPPGVNAEAVERSLDMAECTPLPLLAAMATPAAGAQPHQPIAAAAPTPLLPKNANRPASFTGSVNHTGDIRPLPQIDLAENKRDTVHAARAIVAGSRTWLPLPASLTPSPASMMGLARAGRMCGLTLESAKLGTIAAAQPAPMACWNGHIALPDAAIAQRATGLALRSTQMAANSIAILTPAAAGGPTAPHNLEAAAVSVSDTGMERPRMPSISSRECTLARGARVPMAMGEAIGLLSSATSPHADWSAEYCGPAPRKPAMHAGQIPAGPGLGKTAALPRVKAIEPPPACTMNRAGWTAEEQPCGLIHKPEPHFEPVSLRLPLSKMRALPMDMGAVEHKIESRGSTAFARAFVSSVAFPRARFTVQPIVREPFEQPVLSAPVPASVPRRMLAEFFRDTPLSLRLMAMMIPVLLFIALRPAPVPAATAARPDAVTRFVDQHLTAVRSAIQNRAGIELLDDFRSGLDNWESRRQPAVQWSYDQTGFVKPGALAVYKPSVGLSDYNLEFLGQIDHKALSWVFRAADLNNYYVAKLVLLRAGPMPTLGLVRYAVVDGKEGPHTSAALTLNIHGDTMYRVRLETRGPDFTLYVQNQLVQFWSDSRLKSGGVGFFSARGEQSRIRWVQVSHQYDAIGRLCAYFRPFAMAAYNLQPTNGSWK